MAIGDIYKVAIFYEAYSAEAVTTQHYRRVAPGTVEATPAQILDEHWNIMGPAVRAIMPASVSIVQTTIAKEPLRHSILATKTLSTAGSNVETKFFPLQVCSLSSLAPVLTPPRKRKRVFWPFRPITSSIASETAFQAALITVTNAINTAIWIPPATGLDRLFPVYYSRKNHTTLAFLANPHYTAHFVTQRRRAKYPYVWPQ